MRKKIIYLILLVVMLFAFNIDLKALKCEYSNGKLTATFEIRESDQDVGDATINGELTSSDETHIDNESQGIENWDKVFDPGWDDTKINIKGQYYYDKYRECPPYAVFVDRSGQFDFAVSDESHLSEFETYGKTKQGYAIMPLVSSSREDGSNVEYEGASCAEYTDEGSCEDNEYFACIWNETEYGNYCNTDKLIYVKCGDAFDIPYQAPKIMSFIVNILKIAAPIILIIVSIIALLKAVSASNEDEIKKAQKGLIRKILASVMVFFVISIVQYVVLVVADTDTSKGASEADNLSNCLSCFLNNDCGANAYYKTNLNGNYECTYFSDKENPVICD